MPRFPKREAEIVVLAEQLWRGLWANRPVYPRPPVHPILMRIRSLIYKNRKETCLAKHAIAEAATSAKSEAMEELVEAMKADIRYAENSPLRSWIL